MFLALAVYIFIYLIMLVTLRMQSAAVSGFCDQLETGMPVSDIQASAVRQQLVSAFYQDDENAARLLFVSEADNRDAVCQVKIEDERLIQKKFVLRVF